MPERRVSDIVNQPRAAKDIAAVLADGVVYALSPLLDKSSENDVRKAFGVA